MKRIKSSKQIHKPPINARDLHIHIPLDWIPVNITYCINAVDDMIPNYNVWNK